MKIHVPLSDQKHFWDVLGDRLSYWTFKSKPRCKIGSELVFMFNNRPVATARVSGIEPPGVPWQDGDDEWKVYWFQKTFHALETPIGRGMSIIQEQEVKKIARPPKVINASEVREFVYCPRAWKMKRGGVAPPPEAKKIKNEKAQKGDRFHLEHGKAVVRARQQQSKPGGYLKAVGWGLTMMGVFWWVFSF